MEGDISEGDWVSAKAKLEELIYRYSQLIGTPGVNPFFALINMGDYKVRYTNGERSLELYETIMELE